MRAKISSLALDFPPSHLSPHRSPYVGKTPPHSDLYIGGEEMNGDSDRESHPLKGKAHKQNE
jgi:hypothetical protein